MCQCSVLGGNWRRGEAAYLISQAVRINIAVAVYNLSVFGANVSRKLSVSFTFVLSPVPELLRSRRPARAKRTVLSLEFACCAGGGASQ